METGNVSLAFGYCASEFISCCIHSGHKQIPSALQTMALSVCSAFAKLLPGSLMTALSTVTETLEVILLNNRFVSHLRAYYIFSS